MITGKHLKEGIRIAKELLEKEKDFVNDINVYPVADADTGTNMYNTIAGIWEQIKDYENEHAGQMAEKIAEAALEAARGNSGVILSQFLWGFKEGVGDKAVLHREDIIRALESGKEWAYMAVSNPVEGTMLTIMRVLAERAPEYVKKYDNVADFLNALYQEALDALNKTPEMLAKLGKQKIIDSGAYGYTLVFEGFVRSAGVDVNGYRVRGMHAERESAENGEELYCTNFLLNLTNGTSPDAIKAMISRFGDSIVVVGGGKKVKVHIHTSEPERVKSVLSKVGEVVQERVDRIW